MLHVTPRGARHRPMRREQVIGSRREPGVHYFPRRRWAPPRKRSHPLVTHRTAHHQPQIRYKILPDFLLFFIPCHTHTRCCRGCLQSYCCRPAVAAPAPAWLLKNKFRPEEIKLVNKFLSGARKALEAEKRASEQALSSSCCAGSEPRPPETTRGFVAFFPFPSPPKADQGASLHRLVVPDSGLIQPKSFDLARI